MSATKEIVEIAPRLASPLLAVGSAARAPSTALTRGSPPPRRGGGWRVARRRRCSPAERRRRRARYAGGRFPGLGRHFARVAAIGWRAVKSLVKPRQVFGRVRQAASSFVKFCQALSRLCLTGPRAISKAYVRRKLTTGASAKCSCHANAISSSGGRPGRLRFMIVRVRQFGKTLSRS